MEEPILESSTVDGNTTLVKNRTEDDKMQVDGEGAEKEVSLDSNEEESTVDGRVESEEVINSSPTEEESKLYAYIQQDYTTEIFKIEIRHLPRKMEHSMLMTLLRRQKIKYSKAKVIPARKGEPNSHAYVTLRSAEDRDDAIAKLHDLAFRGCNLLVHKSKPLPDPLLLRKRDNQRNQHTDHDDLFEQMTEQERVKIINDQVCSLWSIPYEDQVVLKLNHLAGVMRRCHAELMREASAFTRADLQASLHMFADTQQLTSNVIQSPVLNGYRNKCEFNVGFDGTVGFRLGAYKHGSVKVVSPPANCPILSQQMHQVVSLFQHYLNTCTQLKGFDPITHAGHWRQILIRTTRSGDCLISITINQQGLSDETLEAELKKVKCHFEGKVSSLYVQVVAERTSQVARVGPRLVAGQRDITEVIEVRDKKLRIRISPLSFFQINTAGAELLYSTICDLANCSPSTLVLDLCCGTGTIGLCLASYVKKVIGVELNRDAIEDAKVNATMNQITNVEFHCGRAELVLGSILAQIGLEEEIVAILDPPRSGLPSSIIKSIRNHERIKRIVYVSCEALAARRNFIDLCRPSSRAYYGAPFHTTKAVPVDLFPHTKGCELILLFERTTSN